MENHKKYIYIAIAIFFFLLTGLVLFQQKMISNLNSKVGKIGQAGSGNQVNMDTSKKTIVAAVKKTITENANSVEGIIRSKTENSFVIDAEVADISKLEGQKEENLIKGDSLPKIKKSFTVVVNDQTHFPDIGKIGFKQIPVGVKVRVMCGQSVYISDNLTASEIYILTKLNIPPSEYIKQEKDIAGKITEINEKYLKIEVNWLVYSKDVEPNREKFWENPTVTKEYKVNIDDKTIFQGDRNSLKVNDVVKAFSATPTFSLTEFTATKIEWPVQMTTAE
ncbi:MAG: hypothetical protein WC831_03505 [Parcubacteria group bacterium]|jgi:hypothetical protein